MFVNLRHSTTNQVKTAKLGFSWTFFFFGIFVPLFRSDWKWFVLGFILGSITLGLSHFVLWFMYNQLYVKDLLNSGWVPAGETDYQILKQKGIIF